MTASNRKPAAYRVTDPALFNQTWAEAFNSGDVDNVLALYQSDAILAVGDHVASGHGEIRELLSGMLAAPGKIAGRNNFFHVLDDVALLRADWKLYGDDGSVMEQGSTAEIIRRQPDGTWLYAVDHASGASMPAVL